MMTTESAITTALEECFRSWEGLPEAPSEEVFPNLPKGDYTAWAEHVIRMYLRARLQFQVEFVPLGDVAAFMVSARGRRLVSLDSRITDPSMRIPLYFHLLGHIAIGDVDPKRYSLHVEIWNREFLDRDRCVREYLADRWAMELVENRVRDCKTPDTSFVLSNALRSVHYLRLGPGGLRAALRTLKRVLLIGDTYKNVRARGNSQDFLARIVYPWLPKTVYHRRLVQYGASASNCEVSEDREEWSADAERLTRYVAEIADDPADYFGTLGLGDEDELGVALETSDPRWRRVAD